MVQAVLCIDVAQRVAVDASGRRAPRGEGALILADGKLSFFPRPSEDGFDAEPWVIDLQQRTLAWSSHGELAVSRCSQASCVLRRLAIGVLLLLPECVAVVSSRAMGDGGDGDVGGALSIFFETWIAAPAVVLPSGDGGGGFGA